MNRFDFESKKYTILIGLICLLFAILILKAFDYLPEQMETDNINLPNPQKVVSVKSELNQEQAQEQYTEEPSQEEISRPTRERELNVDLQKDISGGLKPIDEETAINENRESTAYEKHLAPDEELELKFLTAKKYKDDKQYVKALKEYQAIEEQSTDNGVRARCYEEIANIYGIMKHYGKALSYAQRAYNTSPSSQREMLLARLYYKTGDLDKATKRMNNVLQREFASDRN